MNLEGILYILTPVSLFLITYLLIVSVAWPHLRRHTYLSVYPILFLIIFPPFYMMFLLWFLIVHAGFMRSNFYIYENDQPRTVNATIPPSIPSQMERRMQRV